MFFARKYIKTIFFILKNLFLTLAHQNDQKIIKKLFFKKI